MRTCSIGPDMMELEMPAKAPEAKYWPYERVEG